MSGSRFCIWLLGLFLFGCAGSPDAPQAAKTELPGWTLPRILQFAPDGPTLGGTDPALDEWIGKRRKEGTLAELPENAILLPEGSLEALLKGLDISGKNQRNLRIPGRSTWLHLERSAGPDVLVSETPIGSAPVSEHLALLQALGIKRVFRIGRSRVLRPSLARRSLLLSTGAYRDAGAVLLASEGEKGSPLAQPDRALLERLEATCVREKVTYERTLDYSLPIWAYHPADLIGHLLTRKTFPPNKRPEALGCGQATFFEAARLGGLKAVWLGVAREGYRMTKEGPILEIYDSVFLDERTLGAVRLVFNFLDSLGAGR